MRPGAESSPPLQATKASAVRRQPKVEAPEEALVMAACLPWIAPGRRGYAGLKPRPICRPNGRYFRGKRGKPTIYYLTKYPDALH